MRRRDFIALGAGALVTWPIAGRAQQRDGIRRIGALMAGGGRRAEAFFATFVESLDALGWHEGKNLHIEVRWSRGQQALFESNAAELVALSPDLIVAQATPSVAALRRQTSTIPIVFVQVSDPVGQGFVKSVPRPGGNMTGFSDTDVPMIGKSLEMLAQITPPLALVGALYNPDTTPLVGETMRLIEAAAQPLGIAVRSASYRNPAEMEAAISALGREERAGILSLADFSANVHREQIIALAAHYRLPAVYAGRGFPENGGLMSYGIASDDLLRAVVYIDRILNGEKPGDLPVQYPTKFQTVLNLKTAAALGISFAPSLLARADEVID